MLIWFFHQQNPSKRFLSEFLSSQKKHKILEPQFPHQKFIFSLTSPFPHHENLRFKDWPTLSPKSTASLTSSRTQGQEAFPISTRGGWYHGDCWGGIRNEWSLFEISGNKLIWEMQLQSRIISRNCGWNLNTVFLFAAQLVLSCWTDFLGGLLLTYFFGAVWGGEWWIGNLVDTLFAGDKFWEETSDPSHASMRMMRFSVFFLKKIDMEACPAIWNPCYFHSSPRSANHWVPSKTVR